MPGRPTIYSDAIADAILTRLADGEPLTRICKEPDLPGLTTVYRWLESDDSFRDKYARAREEQADTLADEIVRIADEAPPPDGETGKIDSAWVAWQRNRVEARKWTASKLKPKKYGDKLTNEHTGPDGGAVVIESIKREIIRPE